jgi:hypothetical protein
MRTLAICSVLQCLSLCGALRAQELRVGPRIPPGVLPEQAQPRGRTRALEGAVVGFAVGAAATIAITRSGGSTAPCNPSANQDALNSRECLGLAVAGGAVGAVVGALVGSRFRVSVRQEALPALSPTHMGVNRRVLLLVAIGGPPSPAVAAGGR